MGQHKIKTPDKPKPPKTRQTIVNLDDELYKRMEKARLAQKIPILDKEGKQVGLRTPEMSECYTLWMGTMMDIIDQMASQQERQSALVLKPEEIVARGGKLPLDLMRRA